MINSHFFSDSARSLSLRMSNLSAKRRVDILTQELNSGIKSNIPQSLNGNLSIVTSIESRIKEIGNFQKNSNSLSLKLEFIQAAVSSIGSIATNLSAPLLAAANIGSNYELKTLVAMGGADFNDTISKINTSVEGRFLLSGARSDTPPLKDAATIIDDVISSLPLPLSANVIIDTIDQIFSNPIEASAFFNDIYQGSSSSKLTTLLDYGKPIPIHVTALDEGLRSTIKGTLLLATCDLFKDTLSQNDVRSIAIKAGETLLEASSKVSNTRAEIGVLEQVVVREKVRLDTELSSLETTLSNLFAADPYVTASNLIEAEASLQNIYILSSRLSKLSLSDYLR